MLRRALTLPASGSATFFLWGPRQVGKTTLLRASYPDAPWVDLLKSDEYRRYSTNPERLRQELLATVDEPPGTTQVVIDEVQKVPALLDEVHWLHEAHGFQFALCGSSARKLRRGGVNLLGGRALRFELTGLTAAEIGGGFDIERIANHGFLPRIYAAERPERLLNAYVSDYLQQEIASEGLVRNLSLFADFLTAASFSDSEMVNQTNIARECGVSVQTVGNYFDILEDTLIGSWLPAYTKRPKRRVVQTPKWYFNDVGVVNHLARRGRMEAGSDVFGKAFENWVHHELRSWLLYTESRTRLTYWRLSGGTEVDFLLDDLSLAIEAKSSRFIADKHLKGLRELAVDQSIGQRVVVCLEANRRLTDDGILILPARELPAFLSRVLAVD